MPLHFASPSSSSSSKTVTAHRRLPPLNIMRSLSLCRKSRPTCTLSLAHVSACKLPPSSGDDEAMQVDTLQLDLKFVAVPMPLPPPSKTLRRTKTKTNTKTKSTTTATIPNDINVIPFPTSAQTNPATTTRGCSSPASSISHTSSFKRQDFQKKEELEHPSTTTSSSALPPRKRARMGSLTSPSSSRGTPSPRVRALAQRVPPPRPPTPTPDSRLTNTASVGDEMEIQGDNAKCPVQPSPVDLEVDAQSPTTECTDPCRQQIPQGEQQEQDLDKHGHTELPPYSPSPPPYSPSVVAPVPITSPTPIPLHVPIPLSPSNSSSPTSTITITTTPAISTPRSPPPPPPPSPQRKPRISPSELRFFILLYRTLVSGLEIRRRSHPNTQVRRARDWSRREQHLDGVLIEVDADEVDDAIAAAIDNNELAPSLNEDLEVQDALLALRLRGFLKWNGVEEWLLKVDPPSPFLEDGGSHPVSSDKMDVDVQTGEPPILSSRHLITVLRMRGTCGSKQGPGLGIKNRREKSKLSFCCYQAEDEA